MAEKPIVMERCGGEAKLILNRPETHNPIDGEVIDLLAAQLESLAGDPSVRVVTLRGAGPSFSAGADLKFFLSIVDDPRAMTAFLRRIKRTFVMLEEFPRPVIAVVHGFALAGGLELMMACDLAIAAEDAQLGDQHANYGLFPGGGATQRLPRLIGQRRAKELMYLGSRITGRQAEAIGLVNKAVPPGDLEREVEQWVRNIVEKSPVGLGYMKECIRRSGDVPLAAGLDLEESVFLNYARLGDMQEGLRAFREKRTPRFQ